MKASPVIDTLARVGLAGTCAYLLVGGLMYRFQEKLLFPGPRGEVPGLGKRPGFELLDLKTDDGCTLRGALRKAEVEGPQKLLIFFGGNAERAPAWLAHPRWPQDWSVAAIDYRGYGQSEGEPSEAALFADALHIHDRLVQRLELDPSRIVVVGRSLGSGVATYLASQREVAGVVLVTPYDSITEVAASVYPWLPVRYLLRHAFDSWRRAHAIRTPALFVTAGRDTLIRVHHTERLLAAWGGPAQRFDIPAANHADVMLHEAYWDELHRFIAQLASGRLPGPGAPDLPQPEAA
ncbi:alpha/beta hydrolase [Caldimonas tepidiphila]|uniref:alpha/beta hydrolase n=1 Tax=Caldimonas tepidiphila TaxID=2315841 RepID=UPI00130087F8|nr:alpha/beta fold hydrolase [Caldimonas tepidiphila]